MIPAEAVEAAAKILLGYTGECVCHEGYTGRNLIDPDCRYHDVPPEAAREILAAAAPYIRAQALEDAAADLEVAPYELLDCGAVINDWRDALNVNHGIQAATRFIAGRARAITETPTL